MDIENTIKTTDFEKEMKKSYMDYAMSVIVSRALPDVRDGLKPVHRRILWTMYESNYIPSNSYRKSARIVGDIMGKYHPHGDTSIYEAMVKMAQDFYMSFPLVDGQGNYGSIDGDNPAAMRYTEARMAKISYDGLTKDLKNNCVNFIDNYDQTEKEPVVLPAVFPNILVNGGQGIAVGYATNMPPHNITEVINLITEYAKNQNLTIDEILAIMPGPDFPTNGIIKGISGIRNAYEKGKGTLTISGDYFIEKNNNKEQIIIHEIPYLTNKKNLLSSINELIRNKSIEDVNYPARDESSEEGIRIILELKKNANIDLVMKKIQKSTSFVTNFSINNVCLDSKKQQKCMSIFEILEEFYSFRKDVIRKRTIHLLNKYRNELNKQIALFIASLNIDSMVELIKKSENTTEATTKMMNIKYKVDEDLSAYLREIEPDDELPMFFSLSESQAKDILALPLSSLTRLEGNVIFDKTKAILVNIKNLEKIINDENELKTIMINEFEEIKSKYKETRRTKIETQDITEIDDEDLVPFKEMVLTLTKTGYVKLTQLEAYKEQQRNGKGRSGINTKEDDYVVKTLFCNSKSNLLFFTNRGIVYCKKAYKIPESQINSRGRPIVNYISSMQNGDFVTAIMDMDSSKDDDFLLFITDDGQIRKNEASLFKKINNNGKIAMKLEDDFGKLTTKLIEVLVCNDKQDVILMSKKGKLSRFSISSLRTFQNKNSTGVKAMKLDTKNDRIISANLVSSNILSSHEIDAYLNNGRCEYEENGEIKSISLNKERMKEIEKIEESLFIITNDGLGKKISTFSIKPKNRNIQGVNVVHSNNVEPIACLTIGDDDEIIILANSNQTIRLSTSEVRKTIGRSNKGVKLINLNDNDFVVDVAHIKKNNI